MKILRQGRLVLALMLIAAGLVAACSSARPEDRVHVITWKGDVNPIMARYIERGIKDAEKSNARAIVLQLDTPGGQDGAMRDIIQDIEASSVPVIVYVSPAGGRAASAGTFITMAGHIAAMAPNTTIGAATPINSNGEDIPGALGRKVTNDSVAYIRGIAEERGRNADWAESAVRDAVSVNQNQAVELNVVDFVATSLQDALTQANGRQVKVAGPGGDTATVTLRTGDAELVFNGPSLFEQLLDVIATPDIAFLLLTLGGLALLTEVFHPTFFAGVFGVIALILAYFSLGALPTNWTGVALIGFGFILLGAEIFVPNFGVLGIGGTISLMLGGIILMSGNDANLHVSRWLVFLLAGTIAAFFVFIVGAIFKMRRMKPASGRDALIGSRGIVRSRIDPRGVVWVTGERWEAIAEDGPLDLDSEVIVTGIDGLVIRVKRDPASVKLLPAGSSGGQAVEAP